MLSIEMVRSINAVGANVPVSTAIYEISLGYRLFFIDEHFNGVNRTGILKPVLWNSIIQTSSGTVSPGTIISVFPENRTMIES